MKALIKNNEVVDIVSTEFPVHKSFAWVDCDESVEVTDLYANGEYSKKAKDAVPAPVARVQVMYDTGLGKLVYHDGAGWEIVP